MLLSVGQLQELGDMLRGVQEENERQLESILREKTDLANANFMSSFEWKQAFINWWSRNGKINKKWWEICVLLRVNKDLFSESY